MPYLFYTLLCVAAPFVASFVLGPFRCLGRPTLYTLTMLSAFVALPVYHRRVRARMTSIPDSEHPARQTLALLNSLGLLAAPFIFRFVLHAPRWTLPYELLLWLSATIAGLLLLRAARVRFSTPLEPLLTLLVCLVPPMTSIALWQFGHIFFESLGAAID